MRKKYHIYRLFVGITFPFLLYCIGGGIYQNLILLAYDSIFFLDIRVRNWLKEIFFWKYLFHNVSLIQRKHYQVNKLQSFTISSKKFILQITENINKMYQNQINNSSSYIVWRRLHTIFTPHYIWTIKKSAILSFDACWLELLLLINFCLWETQVPKRI
jgi:hypothetical protein